MAPSESGDNGGRPPVAGGDQPTASGRQETYRRGSGKLARRNGTTDGHGYTRIRQNTRELLAEPGDCAAADGTTGDKAHRKPAAYPCASVSICGFGCPIRNDAAVGKPRIAAANGATGDKEHRKPDAYPCASVSILGSSCPICYVAKVGEPRTLLDVLNAAEGQRTACSARRRAFRDLRRTAAARARDDGRIPRGGDRPRRSRGAGAFQRAGCHRRLSGRRLRGHGRAPQSRLQVRGVLFLPGRYAGEDAHGPTGGAEDARRAAQQAGIPVVTPEISDGGSAPEPAPDDVALVLHTSGSTGRPKRVPLRHRNLAASTRAIAQTYALGMDDVSLCLMPLFHVHGLMASTMATLLTGGTVVVPAKFNALTFWRMVRDYGVTWYSAVPTMHQLIVTAQALRRRETALRALVQRRAHAGPDAPHGGIFRGARAGSLRHDGSVAPDGVESAATGAAQSGRGRAGNGRADQHPRRARRGAAARAKPAKFASTGRA